MPVPTPNIYGPQIPASPHPVPVYSPYASPIPFNCGRPTRTSLLTEALANLEGANSPELANLVRIELKKSQIKDIQSSIARQQAQIKAMQASVERLEASISRLDSDSRDRHTLNVKILQVPNDKFREMWLQLDPKQAARYQPQRVDPAGYQWRRTVKKQHALPLIAAFSKLQGVKQTVTSSVVIRGTSAIAKAGLSVSARRLSPHVTVVNVTSVPGDVRLVNHAFAKPSSMSIALGADELALLTKTHAAGTISLLVIETKQVEKALPTASSSPAPLPTTPVSPTAPVSHQRLAEEVAVARANVM